MKLSWRDYSITLPIETVNNELFSSQRNKDFIESKRIHDFYEIPIIDSENKLINIMSLVDIISIQGQEYIEFIPYNNTLDLRKYIYILKFYDNGYFKINSKKIELVQDNPGYKLYLEDMEKINKFKNYNNSNIKQNTFQLRYDRNIELVGIMDLDELEREDYSHLIKTKKRTDYISWKEYFMGLAKLSAKRSKDPKTQVGSCIVRDNKIISIGYNGFPNNCSDDIFPWDSENKDPLEIKDLYVVHSELNAILNANTNIKGSTLYVTLFPCNECAKAIIQSGIKEVIYEQDKNNIKSIAAKRMFDAANVKYSQYSSR